MFILHKGNYQVNKHLLSPKKKIFIYSCAFCHIFFFLPGLAFPPVTWYY